MSIYKECDIRGIYPGELDVQKAYLIGRAVGTRMTGRVVVVGGDVRLSTAELKEMLIMGLMESGASVINIGMVPTPVFYFALQYLGADGGITVTASHNPAQYNGFKLMFGRSPVTPETIKQIEDIVSREAFITGDGSCFTEDVTEAYSNFIMGFFEAGPGKNIRIDAYDRPLKNAEAPLKVVLDCCNGASSHIAPQLFGQLGYETIPLYCEFDGAFPNRDPNPAVYENLKDLKSSVVEAGADFGAAFDGDGDRVVFVDDLGRVVNSESSFVIFIRDYMRKAAGPVVYDIKSSSIVPDAVRELGGKPLPERSGHAFIKRTFLENKAALGGEISGHFFFSELGFDDGLFAALRMAQIIREGKTKLSAIFDSIPKTVITPDIRIHCKYAVRDSWLEKVYEAGRKFEVTQLDGIKVDFGYGWILVRKSVTEEGITLRIEARDEEHLKVIKAWITEILPLPRL